jgi:hypothetical protein
MSPSAEFMYIRHYTYGDLNYFYRVKIPQTKEWPVGPTLPEHKDNHNEIKEPEEQHWFVPELRHNMFLHR